MLESCLHASSDVMLEVQIHSGSQSLRASGSTTASAKFCPSQTFLPNHSLVTSSASEPLQPLLDKESQTPPALVNSMTACFTRRDFLTVSWVSSRKVTGPKQHTDWPTDRLPSVNDRSDISSLVFAFLYCTTPTLMTKHLPLKSWMY